MSSLSNVSLPKPKDWQDFERKTGVLFACVLGDPNTQLHGRSGQPQHGVDIYGYRNGDRNRLVGVQCKMSNDEITPDEFEKEFEKAKRFEPPVAEFILVTTAPRDAKIQERARQLTDRLKDMQRSIFVAAWGWQDVEEHAARHVEALEVFDPTFNPFVKRVHTDIVARLDDLAGERPPPSRRASPFIVPQLETNSFTGREEELAALERALFESDGGHVCSIAGLSGTGGIGKSALAVHFAMLHRARFPDGVIGIRVDGKDNDTIAREFARNFGESLDPEDERDARSIMQSTFAGREILLIFDNAESPILRGLLPGGRSRVIVTTRDRGLPSLLDVPQASRVDVPKLPQGDAIELLRKRLGGRVDAELEATHRIADLVGALPLALQIVASLLDFEPWRRLADLAAALEDERRRLFELAIRDDPNIIQDDPHLDVRVSFAVSLKRLEPEEEIDFFACLSVCDADSFALRSAAAAGGCSEAIAGRRLGYLFRLSLVNRPADSAGARFFLHPLLRSFAAELLDARGLAEPAGERHARYFIDAVKDISPTDASGVLAMGSDVSEALAAAEWLLRHEEADEEYLIRLQPLLVRFGRWREAADLMARFLAFADARGDAGAAIQIRIQQAKFLQLRGELQQAASVLEAIISAPAAGGRVQAMLLNTYGGVLQRLGKFQEAADALSNAATSRSVLAMSAARRWCSTAWAVCSNAWASFRTRPTRSRKATICL